MTIAEEIQDALVKYKAYCALQGISYTDFLKSANMINSEKAIWYNQYLELYIYLLEYTLDWTNTNGDLEEDSPIDEDDLDELINRANELIHTLFETPLTT